MKRWMLILLLITPWLRADENSAIRVKSKATPKAAQADSPEPDAWNVIATTWSLPTPGPEPNPPDPVPMPIPRPDPVPDPKSTPASRKMKIGMNPGRPVSWVKYQVYTNLIRNADSNQFGGFYLPNATYVPGLSNDYTIILDGAVEFRLLRIEGADLKHSQESGTTQLEFKMAGSERPLLIVKGDWKSTINNIKIYPTQYLEKSKYPDGPPYFLPAWIEGLKDFDVIRSLGFAYLNEDNRNKEIKWADRVPDTQAWVGGTGTPRGERAAPWEDFFRLCEAADCDAWINVPISCEDDYARQLAKLAKTMLSPKRKVIVEKGNECWNTARPFLYGVRTCQKYANANGGAASRSTAAWGLAKLSDKTFRIFEQELGDDRVINTVCWQAVANWSIDIAMDESKLIEALGIAPYLARPTDGSMSESSFWAHGIDHSYALIPKTIEYAGRQVRKQRVKAKARGLRLFAYECGQHFHNTNNPDAAYALVNDPRMTTTLKRYHQMMVDEGIEIACYLGYIQKPTRGFSFGHQDWLGDYDDPRWKFLEWVKKGRLKK